MFGFGKKKPEVREAAQSAANFFELLGINSPIAGQTVNTRTALNVPAYSSAVNFISGTIAGLPLHLYRSTTEGREKVDNKLSAILRDAVKDDDAEQISSFEWRKYTFERVLTGGRGFTLIVRNGRGEVLQLIPLNPAYVTVKRENMVKFYVYREPGQSATKYDARDILDIPFMLAEDRLSHYGPVGLNQKALGLALAVQDYSARFFANGGVPPFVVTGAFQSGKALTRASDDLRDAVKKAAEEGRQALTLPDGLDIKPLGSDPIKAQMLELHRFCVEQVARIFNLPPTFLQDLTHGTYSNTEQQDLHFVKHTLKRWVEQFEQEMNLKLFPRGSKLFVEFSMDGLLRGDIKSRMEAHSVAIQNGIYSPAHAASLENAPYHEEADQIFIQGGTMPIGQQQEITNDDL